MASRTDILGVARQSVARTETKTLKNEWLFRSSSTSRPWKQQGLSPFFSSNAETFRDKSAYFSGIALHIGDGFSCCSWKIARYFKGLDCAQEEAVGDPRHDHGSRISRLKTARRLSVSGTPRARGRRTGVPAARSIRRSQLPSDARPAAPLRPADAAEVVATPRAHGTCDRRDSPAPGDFRACYRP